MRKFLFICLLIPGLTARAQEETDSDICKAPKVALHLSSPLGLITKAGIKAEYISAKGVGVLVSYTRYWNGYPGNQLNFAIRKYFPSKGSANFFIYGLGVLGDASETYVSNDVTFKRSLGMYRGGGAGGGCRINYGVFFTEFSGGLKAVALDKEESGFIKLFDVIGPGAFIDLHFNFGFQFKGD